MIGSLYSGASGVRSYSHDMTVTGSNIANVNTVGFKHNRTNFEDLMATSVAGGTKIGKGVNIGSIQQVHKQGSFETTELDTDLAIDGEGFFALQDKAGKTFYTRAGQFVYDKEGFLTNEDGMYVMVKDVNPETGASSGSLKKINILDQIDPPKPTGDGVKEGTGVNVISNLDSNSKPPTMDIDYENVTSEMYNNSISSTVYDSKGQEHNINVVFRKLADKPADIDPATGAEIPGTAVKNSWQWMTLASGDEIEGGTPGTMKAVGGGFMEFSFDGRLVADSNGVIQQAPPEVAGGPPGPITMQKVAKDATAPAQVGFAFLGSGGPQNIGFTFGAGSNPDDPLDNRTGVDGVTQFANEFKLIEVNADGMKSGKLENIFVKQDGTIEGGFDSGNVKALGRVILSEFKSQESLAQRGNNLYKETFESGQPIENDPGQNGAGRVQAKTLERSNVEMSSEFVKMIEGQRAFQANAKTVTTSDEILSDTIQMKR